MRTQAAVLWGAGQEWKIETVDLGEPKRHEVRVKLAASGLCHSDDHVATGDSHYQGYPVVGGHEGAGVVEAVGPDVDTLAVGDHVVLSWVAACGRCRPCVRGWQNLCESGARMASGTALSDGTHRIHIDDQPVTAFCMLGSFSPYVVVHENSAVRIDKDLPLDKAALVGCGVTTGWGTAVNAGEVRAGDTVVVVGVGGLGMAAVQGARMAGASQVVAVDPVAWKRDAAMDFGATHGAPDVHEALPLVTEITSGHMADAVVLTSSLAAGDLIAPSIGLAGKRGRIVVAAVAPTATTEITCNLNDLTFSEKQLRGSRLGSENPRTAMPQLLDLYRRGQLKLDEMVTKTYTLDEINEGYADLRAGRNIRGLIVFD
ncbi:NDMA-dependent alcohol dehydrogenase [Actinoallomurus sp. CA-150999]|uniref:NDMA-dependent alcohol dehydrogenase n=1 Tax=Actinoallomurus sp. CA-150999 TaxID=3239887 RepID=UPI003D8D861B